MTDNEETNIINFPRKANSKIPPTREEVTEDLDYLRSCHINDTMEFIAPQLFQDLRTVGFDFTEEDTKDGAFFVEALRSLLCKYYGAEHPFQEIAEEVFTEDGEGDFKIADSLNIIFKKDDAEKVDEQVVEN
ncbi:MAG: hypothetical protein P4L79_10565 [Legionella sp.]|uniref:hypothetical protein n=1 Tax=Legionella sp. TaxID=459 RepID=UPI0028461186|nr:hypothetical protein [Legionella sp.]